MARIPVSTQRFLTFEWDPELVGRREVDQTLLVPLWINIGFDPSAPGQHHRWLRNGTAVLKDFTTCREQGCRPASDRIVDFCSRSRLPDARLGISTPPGWKQPRNVWVETRAWNKDEFSILERHHSLTANEFYALFSAEASSAEASSIRVWDRQVIFINDITGSCVWALIGTVPYRMAASLRETLEMHLTEQTCIGVEFPSDDLKTFRLVFHLAYASLTRDADTETDLDPDSDRKQIDIGFLNEATGDPHVRLHKSQASCVLFGIDDTRYSVVCLVDNSFIGEGGRETSERHFLEEEEYDIAMDPCTGGRYAVDAVVNCPRCYWLMILAKRLDFAAKEWQAMREYLDVAMCAWKRANPIQSSTRPHDNAADEWVMQTRELVARLRYVLSSAVNSVEDFCQQYVHYFDQTGSDEIKDRQLKGIQSSLQSFKTELRSLDRIHDECNRLKELLQVRFNLWQRWAMKLTIGLAIVVMILSMSPFQMDGQVLAQVLPWLPMKFWALALSFMMLLVGIIGVSVRLGLVSGADLWTSLVCSWRQLGTLAAWLRGRIRRFIVWLRCQNKLPDAEQGPAVELRNIQANIHRASRTV